MGKISYATAFEKNAIIKNIPLIFEGRKLPKGMSAKVVLVRVQYDKIIKQFEEDCQQVLKGLKKDGFDERAQKYQRFDEILSRKKAYDNWDLELKNEEGKEIEKPEMPTDEELKELEEGKEGRDEFENEQKELVFEYGKAREEKAKELVLFEEKKFSLDELDAIIELIGIDGEITINDRKVSKEMFLDVIGSMFTE